MKYYVIDASADSAERTEPSFVDDTSNKTQILIDASVERYLQKKSKHIEVK